MYETQLKKRIEQTAVLTSLDKKLEAHPSRIPLLVIASDMTRGMATGLLLLIPFLIIDLVVQHIFRLLEFGSLPVSVISFPLKIILFLSVDGWSLITQRLLG